jgi:hypothetical protein
MFVAEAKHISGVVSKVGERTVCIDGIWYELDSRAIGGIRVVEVNA